MTPVISRMARRASGRSVMAPRTVAYTHTAMATEAMVAFSHGTLTRKVARYSEGMVTMSPEAVTSGVETASRS